MVRSILASKLKVVMAVELFDFKNQKFFELSFKFHLHGLQKEQAHFLLLEKLHSYQHMSS